MKSLVIALVTVVSTSALAAQTYTYDCEGMTAKVVVGDAKPVMKLTFKNQSGKGTINIASNISYGSEEHADELDFSAFEFPNGDRYVTAEGDTNEEGFTFTVEATILQGADTVKASTTYWSDWHDNSTENLTCTKK